MTSVVPFTGERVTDDHDFRPDFLRHMAAYHLCLSFVTDKIVLDGGCGEGHGAKSLAGSARLVVGVDRSWETLRQAHRGHLSVSCSDLRSLAFRDGSFDVVCSFQVLEHLREAAGFLSEAARVLRPAGMLILTTPNRLTSFSENPYHVKEYRAKELEELLLPLFSSVEILGVFGSERVRSLESSRKRQVSRILGLDPLGLRRILPEAIQKWAFARLARLVRRQMQSADRESFRELDLSDFTIGKDCLEASLDLIAICRKAERDVARQVPGD